MCLKFRQLCRLSFQLNNYDFSDKGLVTNYGEGGLQNGRGGHVKF